MNLKRILMFVAGSTLAVIVGLAVVNRLKARIPQISTVIGA